MREPAERVGVDSMTIGIELMGGVQNVVDELEEEVFEVDQLMMREVEERKRMGMQSVEATAGADAVVEVAAVAVGVEVDKSSSDNYQRSINRFVMLREDLSEKMAGRCVNFNLKSGRR